VAPSPVERQAGRVAKPLGVPRQSKSTRDAGRIDNLRVGKREQPKYVTG
jgi:hypothetical protein